MRPLRVRWLEYRGSWFQPRAIRGHDEDTACKAARRQRETVVNGRLLRQLDDGVAGTVAGQRLQKRPLPLWNSVLEQLREVVNVQRIRRLEENLKPSGSSSYLRRFGGKLETSMPRRKDD